ncbi:MAG: Tetracycline resistance protein, class C [Chlamydiae bacterium]|nr:Tetracycline resistance protein, class C [Chlamydiota bacterium]
MDAKAKKSFLSALFIIVLDNYGFALVFILFAPLILDASYGMVPAATSTEMRTILLGLLYAAFPITQFFAGPILGDLADRFGRKRCFYITLAGAIFGYLFSGAAILASSYTALLISRFVTGLFSGNLSIGMAVIADVSPTEKLRARNYGIMTAALGISWTLSLLTGAYLANPAFSKFFNPALPMWITAFLSLIGIFVVRTFFEESHAEEKRMEFDLIKSVHNVITAFHGENARRYFILIALWTLGWGLSIQWYNPFTIMEFHLSQTTIAWLLIILGACWMAGGAIINPLLLKRFSTFNIARITLAVASILMLFAALSKSVTYFNIFYLASALFSPIVFSSSTNLISINAPNDIQGRVMGLSQSMMSLGRLLAPLIGGFIGGIDPRLIYFFGTALLAMGLLTLIKKPKTA